MMMMKPPTEGEEEEADKLVCVHPGCRVRVKHEADLLRHIHSEHTSLKVTDLMPPPPAPGQRGQRESNRWWACDDCSLKHLYNSETSLNRHRQQVHPQLQFTRDQW